MHLEKIKPSSNPKKKMAKDIQAGEKYEDWTVLKFDKALGSYGKFPYFLCECSCGNKVSVRGHDLLNGKSISCGCKTTAKWRAKRKDFTGLNINFLNVIKEVSHKLWKVKCICGKYFEAETSQLSGKRAIQSCGCKTLEIIISKTSTHNAYLLFLYRNYVKSAQFRNKIFELSLNQFEKLIKQDCYYCGKTPKSIYHGTTYKDKFPHNGVDRKNNLLGYLLDNCVPCCTTCNTAKSVMGEREFYDFIERVYKFSLINKRIKACNEF